MIRTLSVAVYFFTYNLECYQCLSH